MTPLQLLLREERSALLEILADLRDAEADASRRILALAGRQGIGAVVRRAQFTMIRRQLVTVQKELWQSIGQTLRRHTPGLASAALEAERQIEERLFRSLDRAVPEELLAAQRAYAQRTVLSYWGRRSSRLPLSGRVHRTQALTQGWLDRAINRVILQGGSWRELAQRVTPMIKPETPGGVSYAAKRLARTELGNAFHNASVAVNAANPYMLGMQWILSLSHPSSPGVEVCELLARGHSPGKPAGVYLAGQVPDKPHPNCLCTVISVPMSEDAFLRAVLRHPPGGIAAALAG